MVNKPGKRTEFYRDKWWVARYIWVLPREVSVQRPHTTKPRFHPSSVKPVLTGLQQCLVVFGI